MAIQSPKGTHDLLPEESWRWQNLEDCLRSASQEFGFQELRTPIFEFADLFIRSVGEQTDAVGKEMYAFVDKGGDHLALRPELTACVARAVNQHSLLAKHPTLRLWYLGPMFRRERPAKGRYRQFHQYGAEIMGSMAPESDVECIMLAKRICDAIGLSDYELQVNSLGNPASKQNYRAALVEYLQPHRQELSEDSKRRLDANPLRILDSKSETDQQLLREAPLYPDFLDEESRDFFDNVCALLDALHISYKVNPRLVRGLDYYRHTAFELTTTRLGAQGQIAGGGRYDDIAAQFGGNSFPGVGFALGIERVLMLLEEEGKTIGAPPRTDLYIAAREREDRQVSLVLANELRQAGLKVITDLQGRSMKAQMREANRMEVPFTIMIGESERSSRTALLKSMADGDQQQIPLAELGQYLLARVNSD